MRYVPIGKSAGQRASANISDYAWARHDFSWDRARTWLSGLPDGRGLNIGYEAADRHASGERADVVALRCLDRRGERHELTYAELARQTNRFANRSTRWASSTANGFIPCWVGHRSCM